MFYLFYSHCSHIKSRRLLKSKELCCVNPVKNIKTFFWYQMDAYQQKKEGKRPKQQYFRPGKQKSKGGERVRRTQSDNKRVSNDIEIDVRNQRISRNIDSKDRNNQRKSSGNRRVSKDFERKENPSYVSKSQELTRVRSVSSEYSGINCRNIKFIHEPQPTKPTHKPKHQYLP